MFDFSKADFDGLADYLQDFDFSTCFKSNNIEFIWSIIRQSIITTMHPFIPKVKVKQKKPMWFTSDIRHHLNRIHTLKRICKKCPAARNLSKLQLCEFELQNKFIAAKTNFESDLIQSTSHCNISRIYKYINNITGYSSTPSIISLDSFEAVTNLEKANLFNSYFHSVFTKSSIHLPDNGHYLHLI